ncbi:DUF1579 family protein [Nonomuraea sp. NPDC050328]|uniref:DUF1579 family protein n=1 Tax=Nonomuraea sp. NPDC050328 TaxID=3364361 RepID=UPI00378825EB
MAPHPENRRLDALVGHWRTAGRTVSGPAAAISGTDHYEWLAGEHFLVHRADVVMGGEPVAVLELIGPYDPATGTYPMRAFDNQGAFTTMTASVDADGVWTFAGPAERATLTLAADGSAMAAAWERTEDGSAWEPWMDMTFTRES